MNEPLVVRRKTQIAAPPATVFAFLIDPEKILSWMGAEVTSEAYPGGLYLIKGVGGDHAHVARGAFREVVPVHRLAYTFGWEGGQEVPPPLKVRIQAIVACPAAEQSRARELIRQYPRRGRSWRWPAMILICGQAKPDEGGHQISCL